MQTTETTQQPASDVKSSELLILSQICSLQGNRCRLFWAPRNIQPDQQSHEILLLLIHLFDDTRRSNRSDQELAKRILHNGISTILQPTRTTGKNSQRQRLKFHQYSKDLPGKQLHNYRDTKICGIEKDCMENYSTGSTRFWWNMGTLHWDEQTTLPSISRDLGNSRKTVSQPLFAKSKLYSTADL